MPTWLRRAALAGCCLAAGRPGLTDEPARPLPGNPACAYPQMAEQGGVAGRVEFRAAVGVEGTVESVEILKVPYPGIGFEDAVRSCVEKWRFEPAAAGAPGPRDYVGRVRFRRLTTDEGALRALLERLAETWNDGDEKALRGLEIRPEDAGAFPPDEDFLRRLLEAAAKPKPRWRLELAPEVDAFAFLSGKLADVRQPYSRVRADQREAAILDLTAMKTASGWRFIPASVRSWLVAVPVGPGVPEPRKIQDAKATYPSVAKQARVQGIVILDALVSTEGRVVGIRVLRGIPLMDQAAIEAVRRWVFEPTLLNGHPVPLRLEITVTFQLSCPGAPGPGSATAFTVCG